MFFRMLNHIELTFRARSLTDLWQKILVKFHSLRPNCPLLKFRLRDLVSGKSLRCLKIVYYGTVDIFYVNFYWFLDDSSVRWFKRHQNSSVVSVAKRWWGLHDDLAAAFHGKWEWNWEAHLLIVRYHSSVCAWSSVLVLRVVTHICARVSRTFTCELRPLDRLGFSNLQWDLRLLKYFY